MEISSNQCRAARALLNWTAEELADRAGVSVSAIRNFEAGKVSMMAANRRELVRTFEGAGVSLAREGDRVSIEGPAE